VLDDTVSLVLRQAVGGGVGCNLRAVFFVVLFDALKVKTFWLLVHWGCTRSSTAYYGSTNNWQQNRLATTDFFALFWIHDFDILWYDVGHRSPLCGFYSVSTCWIIEIGECRVMRQRNAVPAKIA
jgi:hypothetical protein